jgi:hypothetical protein
VLARCQAAGIPSVVFVGFSALRGNERPCQFFTGAVTGLWQTALLKSDVSVATAMLRVDRPEQFQCSRVIGLPVVWARNTNDGDSCD